MFKVVESTGIYDSLDPLQKEYKNILKSGFSVKVVNVYQVARKDVFYFKYHLMLIYLV